MHNTNISIVQKEEYDAIVVGSGVSGGWAAKELTEKGLKTLVLERGRAQEHGDYPTEHKQVWELENRGRVKPDEIKKDYAVQSRYINSSTKHFHAKDSEHPFVEDKPFIWVRGDQVGGRSLIWGRGVPRWSPLDFEAPVADGHGIDWPIRYNDISPWYDYVERFDEEKDRAVGVRVVDRESKEMIEYYSKVVFLCASALGSTHILLNSTSNRFPDGLANSSGVLGHYLMDHHFRVGGSGTLPGMEDRYYIGNRPSATYIPRFRNVGGATGRPNYVRGFHYAGGASRAGWGRGGGERGIGASLKEKLRDPGPWRMSINAFGEMLPEYDNHVYLDAEKTDQWGIPLLHISCEYGSNELEMRKDMKASAGEMLEAAGASDIYLYDQFETTAPGDGIHEMGTARMGRDPKTSVLNQWNQAHDVPNLFITDGACMTSSACQNPSITYMALTARACDYAVKAMKRNEL